MAIDLSTLGKRVAHIRKQRGMNQSDLARATGFSQPSIWALEKDATKEVSASLLGAVSAALSTPWEFLLYGSGQSLDEADLLSEAELLGIYRGLDTNKKVSVLEFARHLKASASQRPVTNESTQQQTAGKSSGTVDTPVKKYRMPSKGLFDVQTGSRDAVGEPGRVPKQRRRKDT